MPEVQTADPPLNGSLPDNLEHKSIEVKIVDEGKVEAIISTFGVVDRDGDIMTVQAFTASNGKEIPMVGAHDWTLHGWIGKGTVSVTPRQARFTGEFFMETADGQEAFKKVKAMGKLQEWSIGFQTQDSEWEKRGEQQVRVIKGIELFEASPVLVGAARGTRTLAVKAAPGSDEAESKVWDETDAEIGHSLRDAGEFQKNSFRRITLQKKKPRVFGIIAKLKGESTTTLQSLRFPKDDGWTMATAKKWVTDHPDVSKALEPSLDLYLLDVAQAVTDLAQQVQREHEAMSELGLDIKDGFAMTEASEKGIRSTILELEGLLAGEPRPRAGDNGERARQEGLNELTAALAEAKED